MAFRYIDKALRKAGWVEVRIKGSHHMYKHEKFTVCVSVPDHGKESISTGVIKSIDRATGLTFR